MPGISDRKDPRVPLAARIQIKTEGLEKFIQKFSNDISKGGMFIRSATPLPVGKEVHLSVILPGGSQLFDAKGKVTWIRIKPDPDTGEPAGMGIQFTAFAEGSENILTHALAGREGSAPSEVPLPRTPQTAVPPAPPAAPPSAPRAAPPRPAQGEPAPPPRSVSPAAQPRRAIPVPTAAVAAPKPASGPSLSLEAELFESVEIPVDVIEPDPVPAPPPPKVPPPQEPRATVAVPPAGGKPVVMPVAAPATPPPAAPKPAHTVSETGVSNILGDIEAMLSDAPPAPVAAPTSAAGAVPEARGPSPATPAGSAVVPVAPGALEETLSGRVEAYKDVVLGIDLGTTYSCAAFVRNGQVEVVPVDSGARTLPSVVTLTAADQVVGRAAYDRIATHPKNTIYGSKRLLGRKYISRAVQDARKYFDYEIVGDENGNAAVRIEGEIYPLVMVTSKILEEIRHWARLHFGHDVTQAVICVPAYYNDNQRAAVIEAGRNAGFDVRRIVNEPVAAAVAYGCDKGLSQKILVYDLGGGTFDVSVMELNANVFDVIAAGGDPYLGGVDLDNRLVDFLVGAFLKQTGIDVANDKVAILRLRAAAEQAKRDLSEKQETRLQLPHLARAAGQPVSFDLMITRADLERATFDLVDRTLRVCAEVLEAAGLDRRSIDDVLLVGGQTRMPLIQSALTNFFGKPPRKGVHPDEAVATGAAQLAASIDKLDSVVLLDVVSMSIGIALPGGLYRPVLLRNSKLPATASTLLATTRDDMTSITVDLFQGDFTELSRNDYLGTIELEGLQALPAGQVRFEIIFRMDAQGFLVVNAKELSSGITQQVTFRTRESPEALQAAVG